MLSLVQAATGQGAGTREGALMHAEVESLEALVVICGWGPQSHLTALEAIAAVDKSSRGVPMRQVTFPGFQGCYAVCHQRLLPASFPQNGEACCLLRCSGVAAS